MMSITDCITEIISSSSNLFETNQEKVIRLILIAEKVVFLDTCFVTKTFNLRTADLFKAFEKMADSKEEQKIVFVITELVLYELKDSETNELQVKNKEFFEKMSAQGFSMLILKEETVYENIKPFMSYSIKKWNEKFATLIHDNIANLSFNKLIKTDSRIPYFGFSEIEYQVPDNSTFISDIIVYLKNAKRNKDSMAEELICISLFFIFELTRRTINSEYIFCTHDFGAIARMNKAIQTSYPNMQKQLKTINLFSMVQYMINEEIITSKEEALYSLRRIMGDRVKLVVRNDLPFSSLEKTITIEEAVENIFSNEPVELVGRV